MTVPEKIWANSQLDTMDKLILALIGDNGADRTPADIAKELGTSQKRVSQKINRLCKAGHIAITITHGTTRMEVQDGCA